MISSSLPQVPQTNVLLRQQGIDCYHFPLCAPTNEALTSRVPIVCFQIDEKLVSDPDNYNTTGFDMVGMAMSRLKASVADWKWTTDRRMLQVERKDGDAATKILDRSFMTQACILLGTESLLVSVPNAHTLLVTAYNSKKKLPKFFIEHVNSAYHKLVYQQISDLAFVYSEGLIKEAIDIRQSGVRVPKRPSRQPLELTARQQFSFKEVEVFTGNYFYSARIASQDDSQLFDLCGEAIYYLLNKSRNRADFIGVIEFITIETINPYSDALDDRLAAFVKLLENSLSLREEVELTNRSIEICFRFGGDENNNKLPRRLIRIGLTNH